MNDLFRKLATKISAAVGSPKAFAFAMSIIVVWAILGPVFNYSNTWQLFINTVTTVVTFTMVFLIQNTQNRDSKALHLKLDELLRTTKARNRLVGIEGDSDIELQKLEKEFHKIRVEYEDALAQQRAKRRKNNKQK